MFPLQFQLLRQLFPRPPWKVRFPFLFRVYFWRRCKYNSSYCFHCTLWNVYLIWVISQVWLKWDFFCLDSFFVRLRQVETLVWMVPTLFVLSVGKYCICPMSERFASLKCPFERVQSKTNCVTIFFLFLGVCSRYKEGFANLLLGPLEGWTDRQVNISIRLNRFSEPTLGKRHRNQLSSSW